MKRPPSHIRILGTDWTVEFSKDLEDDADEGKTLINRRRILLNQEADEPVTLLHELLHAIEFSLNIELNHDHLHGVARCLTAVLRDNPPLARWLLNGGEGRRKV